jgi:Uncharacterised nucleotidyltransferase
MFGQLLSGRNGHGRLLLEDIELPEFPSELALVIACSRWPLGETERREIRTLAAAPINWDRFLAWVQRNRIAPLVYRNLQVAGSSLVPDAIFLQLQSEFSRNALRVVAQVTEAARISRLLADAGIRSMIIKGPVLSQLAFGDPVLRESKDVDLVIDADRVPEVDRMIIKAGYRRLIPDIELTSLFVEIYLRRRCQFTYYLEKSNCYLELHWRLTANPLLMPFDSKMSWRRTEPVYVAGAKFVTLPDEELLLYLCVHGSVHMWFRLKWLADIAALLQKMRPEAIDRIASRARALKLDRSFHQAIILANKLMRARVAPKLLLNACRDKAAKHLAIAACRALNWQNSPGEPMETQWFSAWVNWHGFNLRPGLRFRWGELQNQMFSPEDVTRFRLPERLFFLYVPLRPVSWIVRSVQRLLTRS